MNWNELLRLCIGIIAYPRRTLAYIISGNFLFLGAVVWVIFCATDTVAAIIHTLAMQTEDGSGALTATQIVTHPATIIRTFSIFVNVCLMNAIAKKIYGLGGKYLQLITCMFFILAIPTVFQPILLILFQIGGEALTAVYGSLSLGLFFWMAFLEMRAVMMVYDTPFSTAITIWFVPVILSGTVLFLLQ